MEGQIVPLWVLQELGWQSLGTGRSLPGCPYGLLVGNDSQDLGLGGMAVGDLVIPSLASRLGVNH